MSGSYLNIERQPWGLHNGVQGAGGCPAKIAECMILGDGTVFLIKGTTQPQNANTLWYQKAPPLGSCSNFQLSYDLITDSNDANVWARERDLRISVGGWDFNFSCQILEANGGELDISDQSSGWVSTGYKVPPLNTGVVHHFQHFGSYNGTSRIYGYTNIIIDGLPYPISSRLQSLKATQLGWPDGFYTQFQQDVKYKQGVDLGFAEKVVNMNLVAW